MMTPTFPHNSPPGPTLGLCSSLAPHLFKQHKARARLPLSRMRNQGSERDAVQCHLCMTQHWGGGGRGGGAGGCPQPTRLQSSILWVLGCCPLCSLDRPCLKGESPSLALSL